MGQEIWIFDNGTRICVSMVARYEVLCSKLKLHFSSLYHNREMPTNVDPQKILIIKNNTWSIVAQHRATSSYFKICILAVFKVLSEFLLFSNWRTFLYWCLPLDTSPLLFHKMCTESMHLWPWRDARHDCYFRKMKVNWALYICDFPASSQFTTSIPS